MVLSVPKTGGSNATDSFSQSCLPGRGSLAQAHTFNTLVRGFTTSIEFEMGRGRQCVEISPKPSNLRRPL